MNTTATNNNVATIDSKKPTSKQELIATNIKLLIEQLEAGHSAALTNYLTAMSRFHSYSFGNVLEIARQMPTATRVAGFWTWKNLGRSVKSGQKGIRILAPIVGVRRKKDTEAQKEITKQNERVQLGFRNAYVFDVSQTDGVDLPIMHEVSGDPGENIDRLAAFLNSRGIQLAYNEKIAPALGISYGGRIALLPGQSKAETFAALVHETAHLCCVRSYVV
jgi:antirestriction protein ArdC